MAKGGERSKKYNWGVEDKGKVSREGMRNGQRGQSGGGEDEIKG